MFATRGPRLQTDPFNVLAYTEDPAEPFSAADQDRTAYSGGVRLDHTYIPNKEHVIKTGFQIDRTQTVNKTRLFTFADEGRAIRLGTCWVWIRTIG